MRQSTAPPNGARVPFAGVVVGGAVRDALLGRAAVDVDWLVGDPEACARAVADATGGSWVVLDAARGHHRVVWGPGVAGASSGARSWDFAPPAATPHAQVATTPLSDNAIHHDLLQRDLSINALAWDPASERLIDPTGGARDVRKRVVRALSPENLRADPLRAWRVVRFAAQLGFRVEEGTLAWTRAVAAELADGRLRMPAPERVGAELDATLMTPQAGRAMRLLDELGLLALHLPALVAGRGVVQGPLHHLDALAHQLEALQQLVDGFPQADLALRWATLLHDIGKSATQTPEAVAEDGLVLRARFHHHERVGATLAARTLRQLRRPAALVTRVQALVAAHMRPLPSDGRAVARFVHRLRPLLPDLLQLMLADREAARGKAASAAARTRYRERVGAVLAALEQSPPLLPLLDGHTLMRDLGVPQGPRVGALLRELAEAQALGDVRTRDEALDYARGRLAQGRD